MPSNEWLKQLNPDSAVPADAMSEEQTRRSERKSQPEADPPPAEIGLCLTKIYWFQLFQKFQWFQPPPLSSPATRRDAGED